ncbi:MAG TPA: hypothetical protein VFZ09_27680 [Archangium sp.]|uniref:hypothetical protein n=1 Tax=Archangium sp. TaxID=1872627 RepID=UPI002E3071D0|nr:hypothetical protein [Archangium sp.]HEX5750042.1 hypothetical protein [Archangium sp.]
MSPVVAGEHTASTRETYWHGGVPGLKVGDYVLPPSITRTRFILSAYEDGATSRPGYQPTRVYVASEYVGAEVFAAMYPGGGWVYRVVPEGQFEHDPDVIALGRSWACERARVVDVVPLSPDTIEGILDSVIRELTSPQDLRAPTQNVRAPRGGKGGAA